MSGQQLKGLSFTRGGMVIGGEVVPLYSGSVHYWRLERSSWRPALEATKKLGVRFIDTYIPWGVHETAPGQGDFGEIDARLDVVAFLELVHQLGLYAIVRPGPHINAELTFFGIPERVIWDPACQARSPHDNPVMLPMVPLGFPVPSYASEVFLTETDRWFSLVGARIAPLRYPDGPIVLCQVDNEGAFYFRDGPYDQDYRPEAIDLYRRFLGQKYETEEALALAHGKHAAPFDRAMPPTLCEAENADDLTWHVDWAEFQEHLIATSLARMHESLARAGLGGVPTFHNMTMGYEATPLSAARIGASVDLVGLDYYHRATPTERLMIERRTTELASRSEGLEKPSFACEMGAGFPPFFFPIPDEQDNQFTVMTALAYGLRGFNIYMAVERDRWIGAPIDARGEPRSFARFWQTLIHGLEQVRFHELRRKTPVSIVMPALKRRLNRALHAFSPATPALFAILGNGSHESCYEDDFGLGGAVAAETDSFIECFEGALSRRHVPFAHVDSDSATTSLAEARWIICPTAVGMDPILWRELKRARAAGARVTIGPRLPSRDGSLRLLEAPLDASGFDLFRGDAQHPHFDADSAGRLVDQMVLELKLDRWDITPSTLWSTVHADAKGQPRVLFVINPTTDNERATVDLGTHALVTDLLDGTRYKTRQNTVDIPVLARSVRMLKIDLA